MKKQKKSKGITLIVLVITIILLVILAGLTTKVIVDSRVFEGAQNVVDESEEQLNDHQEMVNEVRNMYR